tara:strand:- start:11955 stop:12065 length:111 start_codon:yes stop_codon:yes gene_type:complete
MNWDKIILYAIFGLLIYMVLGASVAAAIGPKTENPE